LARAAGILALSLAAGGCGSGSGSDSGSVPQGSTTTARIVPGGVTPPTQRLLAAGSKARDCDVVFDGPGPADWRRRSLAIGPFGLSGPDFHESPRAYGLLIVKTPMLVAGHRPVTISIPRALRYRAAILGVHPGRSGYARVTYVPCADKPRTVFAAGFLLRDRRPISLLVKVGDGPTRGLYLSGRRSSG
jgi:hypothetical protein